jgi:hypothetical protein
MRPGTNIFRVSIYLAPASAAVITFILYQHYNDPYKTWFQSLCVAAVQVFFTVFLVDNLVRWAEARRTKPARIAAFRDALMIYGRTCLLWGDMVKSAYDPHRDNHLLNEKTTTFLDESLSQITARLNLDSDAPVVPKVPWRVHFHSQANEILGNIGACLQRYGAFLNPSLILALQDIERSAFMGIAKIITIFPAVDAEIGFKRGPNFGFGDNGLIKILMNLQRELKILLPEFVKNLPPGTRVQEDFTPEIKQLLNVLKPKI